MITFKYHLFFLYNMETLTEPTYKKVDMDELSTLTEIFHGELSQNHSNTELDLCSAVREIGTMLGQLGVSNVTAAEVVKHAEDQGLWYRKGKILDINPAYR
jgi:hypothetical protein